MGNQCTKEDASISTERGGAGADSGPKSKTYRESVLDITGKPVEPNQSQTDQVVPRLKNIFAAPVKILADFVFPNFSKTDEDRKFIETVLQDNFIFAGVDKADLVKLLDAFQVHTVADGNKIITEGETGDYFYILQKGNVSYSVGGKNVGEASDGSTFGDLALLYDCPRAATCKATEDCILWRVDQTTFRQILANGTVNKDRAVMDTLKKVSFLKELSMDLLSKIAQGVDTKKYSAGTTIIEKGAQGLEFFIIKHGTVSVEDIQVGGRSYDDQTLTVGDYFGERALVQEEPRAANVIATEDTTCLTLTREKFLENVGPLENLIMKANDVRKLKGIPAFARSDVSDAEYKILGTRITYATMSKGEQIYSLSESKGAGIYFLHKGKITISGKTNKVITQGGYFGVQDTLFTEQNLSNAVVDEDSELGHLPKEAIAATLRKLRRIYEGSQRMPLKRQASSFVATFPLKELKKYRILGVGTFGKVWLVSRGDTKEAYALKIQRKRLLLQHQQVEGVLREMKIMAQLDHPFVLNLVNIYQDSGSVMMLVKLIQGGELYSVMKRHRRNMLPERDAKFYASAILEGLSYMHNRNILYRDLKPENVLIDKDGYPCIVDLGFAKEVEDKTFTLCGTPWYIAPEVILGRGHDKACDHWSWAVLCHEMVSGDTPFAESGSDQMTLFKAIVRGKYKISKRCNSVVEDLVTRVLVTRPSNRLGSLAGAEMDIKKHPWLADVDFDKLAQKKFKAPWVPVLKDALDVSEFDNWDHMAADDKETALTAREQSQFKEVDKIAKKIEDRV